MATNKNINECTIKAHVRKLLKQYNLWYYMPIGGMYSRQGIPDFIGCYYGYFFTIECKSSIGKLTPLQEQTLEKIKHAGGKVFVVNSKESLEKVRDFLNALDADFAVEYNIDFLWDVANRANSD